MLLKDKLEYEKWQCFQDDLKVLIEFAKRNERPQSGKLDKISAAKLGNFWFK